MLGVPTDPRYRVRAATPRRRTRTDAGSSMTDPEPQPKTRRRLLRTLLRVVAVLLVSTLLAELVLRWTHGVQNRFEWHAQAGYANASHADFEFRERRVRTGAAGRVASPVPTEGPPGLLVVGDSYAAGQAAPWPLGCIERTSQRLAERQPGFWTLNFGTSGYGTDQSLFRLREGLPQRPRTVVYMLFSNDLHDNEDTLHFGLSKPRFALTDNVLKQVHWPSPWLNRLLLESALAAQIARPFIDPATQMVGWKSRSPQQRADLAAALIETMRNESESAGARFLVIAHWEPLMPEPDEDFAILLAQLERSPAPLLVLNREVDLASHYDQPRWHWNSEGHALAADAITAWLLAQDVLQREPVSPR